MGEPEPQPIPDPEPDPEPEAEPEAEPTPEAEAKPTPEAGAEPTPEAVPDSEPTTDAAPIRPAAWRGLLGPRLPAFLIAALAPSLLAGLLLLTGAPARVWAELSGADRWEPNAEPSQAHVLDGPGSLDATCPRGDVDYYAIDVPAGKALSVTVDPAAEGQGSTTVHDPQGIPVAKSQRRNWADQVVWVPEQPGRHLIRVWGERGTYRLTAELVSPRRRFEPNGTQDQAAPLEIGAHTDLLCDGDDWFQVSVPAHRGLLARLDGEVAQLGLEFVDGAQVSAIGSAGVLSHEAEAQAMPAMRKVLLHVGGAQAGYDLELELSAPDPAALAARQLPRIPGSFEPNDEEHRAARISRGVYPDLTCDGADWYLVEVPEPDSTLTVTIAFNARSNLGLLLMDPFSRNTEQSYGAGTGTHSAQAYLREGGNYYVHVYGDNEPYSLTVDTTVGPPGELLLPGDYAIQGTGDDTWRIDALAGQTVSARCVFDASRGDIDVSLATVDGIVDQSAGYSSSEQVSYASPIDQPLFLRVYGPSLRYSLTLAVDQSQGLATSNPAVTAPRLERGEHQLQSNGQQTYQIELLAGQRLDVTLRNRNAGAWISGELQDPNGNSVSSGQSESSDGNGNTVTMSAVAEEDGPVLLETWTSSSAPGAVRFTALIEIDGRSEPDPEPLDPGRYGGLECPGNVIYEVPVTGGQRLVATIEFSHADGDLDLALADELGNELARSETTEDVERVEWVAPLDMTVRLRVHNAPNVFDLTLEVGD